MLNKTFSVRSNAIRNARSQLGKDAKQNVHFTVGGEKGAYTWSPVLSEINDAGPTEPVADTIAAITDAGEAAAIDDGKPASGSPGPELLAELFRRPVKAKVHKAKAKSPKKTGRKAGRKQVTVVTGVSGKRRTLFKMVSTTNGASLRSLVNVLGWQRHTIRGAFSTICSEFGLKKRTFKDNRRGLVYKVA